MHDAIPDKPPRRMWTAMLASLPSCYGCQLALRDTAGTIDGFCRDCLDRSRTAAVDELGGES